ncbi:MAG: multidrug effflux MFS transporter [Proteobacteria bacterium]|nr:multidrug effflux MFS transporter [Pseudomonadota bacterium]
MQADSRPQRSSLFILCLLGSLSVVSPFSIDMYLTAYLRVASDFGVPTSAVSLTLSAYFIGLASGQLFYGPLLDRFGRKAPLAAGLLIFLAASIGCALSTSLEMLVALRFLQGLGGCGAQVASLAMVRDFFPPRQSARILSSLFLFIAVSPLAAPTVGGIVVAYWGWRAVFAVLFVVVALILALVWFLLPEGHQPDRGVSLKPLPIVLEYGRIARHPAFATYAFAGALSFSGLFAYVAGSPIVFMDNFRLSAGAYSGLFAALATGLIGASQLNVLLLRRFSSRALFGALLAVQVAASLVFALGTWSGAIGLYGTVALFFVCLSCLGIINPNGSSLALSPFSRNAGSAAALLGFIQLGIGAVISSGISMGKAGGNLTVIGIFAVTSLAGGVVLLVGARRARAALAARDIAS